MSVSRVASTVVLTVVLVLAGCTGTLFAAEASPATIPQSAYESVGYVHGNTTAVPLGYTVGTAGISRNVTVTSQLSGYSRTVADDEVSLLLVLSTPNVEVAGESVNPFARMADGVLLDRVLNATATLNVTGYVGDASDAGDVAAVADVGDLRRVDAVERTVLETPTTVTTYAGTVEIEGTRVAALVHVAVVEHGDDVVVAVAVHPESMDETARIHALVEAIEHEATSE
ncbi:hypothetical protein SAMN04487949_0966 [Halogranum gelatinilyticum]|uniref:Uncharacterized protein n=1 Tax=Halogranum gelatinilyticum TaxID=660521 RepID=A0A1G9QPM4_9EURY|nr:DUF6517 family protein [Halogranum gelatinilyticum]SDM12923.1 hypothetical protein SAMN04487949_0966 [Halogranum gelatinilyticum]